MFYTDVAEIREYLPERLLGALTNDGAGLTAPVDEIIETAIGGAEDEVNSYLAKHYRVPVKAKDGTIPHRIKTLVYSITKYQLFTRANLLTPEISDEYDKAIRYLSRIAKGELTMPALDADGNDKNATDFAPVSGSNYRGLFNHFDRV